MKDLKLASYNLGFSIEDRLVRESLEDALDHEGVDIAALQEVATGKLKLRNHAFDGEKYAFYISKGNAACKPVGFAVKRSLIEKFGSPTIDCFGPEVDNVCGRHCPLCLICRGSVAKPCSARGSLRAHWTENKYPENEVTSCCEHDLPKAGHPHRLC